MASEPTKSHAAAPTMPAPTVDPSSRPKILRSTPPTTGTTTNRISSSVSKLNPPPGRRPLSVFGGGSGLPSATTAMIRSTPASIPAANRFSRNAGATFSAMIRRAVTSVSVPSRP